MSDMTDTNKLCDLLSVTEAAARLGRSERTLWRLIKAPPPDFPRPIRHGGRVYLERATIEAIAQKAA